jgi:hypothetical protein
VIPHAANYVVHYSTDFRLSRRDTARESPPETWTAPPREHRHLASLQHLPSVPWITLLYPTSHIRVRPLSLLKRRRTLHTLLDDCHHDLLVSLPTHKQWQWPIQAQTTIDRHDGTQSNNLQRQYPHHTSLSIKAQPAKYSSSRGYYFVSLKTSRQY